MPGKPGGVHSVVCPNCGKSIPLTEALTFQITESVKAELDAEYEQRGDEVSELKKQELELRKQRANLERERDDLELDVQRKVDEERTQIRKEAADQAEEKYRLTIADLEKKNADVSKQLDGGQRKAAGISAQVGGKVQERVLAELLEERFPDDEITVVKTGGTRGGRSPGR